MNRPFEIDILIEIKRKKDKETFMPEKKQKIDFRVKLNDSKRQKVR